MSFEEQIDKLQKYLRGEIVKGNNYQHFIIHDLDEITHSITVADTFVCIRPVSANHMILIGCPDKSIEPDKEYETSLYIADHASVLIKGHKKGNLKIRLEADEFPTKFDIDVQDCISKETD